jgi:predicted DNA binding CopG/RHH family protein
MTTKQPSTTTRIPKFASIEEEAEFWDTHDTTDFEAEFKPVRVRFAKPLSEGITVRLDPDTLIELRSLAGEQGLGPTTLARMWIRENLRRKKAAHSPK